MQKCTSEDKKSIPYIPLIYLILTPFFVLFYKNACAEITSRFGNTGLFSSFISINTLIYIKNRTSTDTLHWFETILLIISNTVCMTYFQSRVSFLILFLGIATLMMRHHLLSLQKIFLYVSLPFIFVGLFSVLNTSKMNSTKGRLLIYKVCMQNSRKIPLFGHGINSFKKIYPLHQAKYYREGNMTQDEILLADNVKFAFNEFFQIIFEKGIIGFLLILLFLFFLLRWDEWHFFIPLLPLFMFSYPLHNYSIVWMLLLFWSLHTNVRETSFQKEIKSLVFIPFSILFSIPIFQQTYYLYIFKKELSIHKSISPQMEKRIYHHLQNNPDFLLHMAVLSYNNKEIQKSIFYLRQILEIETNSKIEMILADIYTELNSYREAFSHYRKCHYLNPGKLRPQYQLFLILKKWNKEKEALDVAPNIKKTPIKVNSPLAIAIKMDINNYIKDHS